ncbi:maleylpyruvate isomerase N-terminal domain-containing protein [Kitasatospora sp. NPDC087861]|uniref:maleylpyruvate isomerase N-terminal domain-containing protein n=1 Tax=Kitasatospora sp. NPDC087861 TaxID=3364070 RepID=UPI0038027A85
MRNGDAVRTALEASLRALTPHTEDRDWGAPAGLLEWSCRDTAAHLAHDLLAYAGQLAARPTDRYLPLDLTVRPDTGPAQVLTVVTAAGRLLATALDAAPPELRAYHHGPCDPPGFAAMGVAETLLHTHDIARGLGLPWQPPRRPLRPRPRPPLPARPGRARRRAGGRAALVHRVRGTERPPAQVLVELAGGRG